MRRLAPSLAALAVATPAGLAAEALGAPLPWLLGPLVATALAAMTGLRVLGTELSLPAWVRPVFVPVIGVAIGCTVTPGILEAVPRWWPSLAAVPPYVVAVQLLNYALLRALGGFDRPTAFFAASPGGLVDAVLIGESRGGRAAEMSTQHFARIALTVAAAPLIVSLLAAPTLGGGAADLAAPAPPGFAGAVVLLGCAALGASLGLRLRLPAALMLGPFLLSAGLHLADLTAAEVPGALVHLAQLAVGATLGLQFRGLARRRLIKGLGLSAAAVGAALIVAGGLAAALAPLVEVPTAAVFLAFAPGGVAEMGLVAVSLGAEPAFVVAHHLLRIVATVAIAPVLFDRLIAPRGGPGADASD